MVLQYASMGKSLTTALVIALALLAPASASSPDLKDYERATNQSLLWGPYRPNVYFGVRPRLPDGLQMGLLWTRVEDYESIQHSKPATTILVDRLC
jgi:mannosyl-oligosaccharide glucosidase